ncbi:MAG: sulfotransferase [Chloroflexi bacterium]|nr:sulfotransferase [Chloroflexota bacterium]
MPRVLVITGMHRSGTSLVASLFHKAGVHLGAQLLAPQQGNNPLGFFEDVEFIQFHTDALQARGQEILVTRDFSFHATDAETQRARAIIAARAAYPLWGWKDPRTTLCLDFWRALLPDARYLFVYRHPLDVLLSLARRSQVVGFDFYAGLEAWYAYNRALLVFAQQYPEITVVSSSYALVEQIEAFNAALAQKFDLSLSLNAAVRDEIFQAELLSRPPHPRAAQTLLEKIHPDAMQLYDALQACTVLKHAEPLVQDTPEQNALVQFVAQLPTPLNQGQRRAILEILVALTDGALYERLAREHVEKTTALEIQRRAWERTAHERAEIIRDQSAWAAPRLKYLETLEANRIVRALTRLGILPRG